MTNPAYAWMILCIMDRFANVSFALFVLLLPLSSSFRSLSMNSTCIVSSSSSSGDNPSNNLMVLASHDGPRSDIMHEADMVILLKSFSERESLSEEGEAKKDFRAEGLHSQFREIIFPLKLPSEKFVSKNVSKNFVLVLGGFLGQPLNKRVPALVFGSSDSPSSPLLYRFKR